MSGLSEIGGLARTADPDRFLCALFLPVQVREAMFALIAWNAELARAREVASQPMIALIRLQWWRDALDEAFAGKPVRRHEVATPLAEAIRAHDLPRAPFERAMDAREAVIEDPEPPRDLDVLAARAQGEAGPLFELGLALLGERGAGEAAEAAGEAYGLVGLLRSVGHLAARGEFVLPVAEVEAAGSDVEAVLTEAGTEARRRVAQTVGRRAKAALERAPFVPKQARAAMLPLVLARASLRRLERFRWDPLADEAVRRGTRDRVALAWAAWTKRI